MQLLKEHSWRIAFLKRKTADSLEAYSATRIHCNVVLRHLAKLSSGIFNLWCHITLSQTLNQLLSPHIEIQMRILISQPDKKIEMLMIYWRQEVYKHRWFAPAQTHLEALTADCRGTRHQRPPSHLAVSGSKFFQAASPPHGAGKGGTEEALRQNQETAHLPFHNQRFKTALMPCSAATGRLSETEGSCFFLKNAEKSNTFLI